jgi:alpha/beta superfamily hydrolase
MKTYSFFYLLFGFIFLTLAKPAFSKSKMEETAVILSTPTGNISGTLLAGRQNEKTAVALIIAGSGPTDRDGNNPMMKNDALKKLAIALSENNIASLRYDKRGIAQSASAAKQESDLRFEDYVTDAASWVDWLKKQNRFSKIIIIGHSEGSLIGMLAAASGADLFISIAGAGQAADLVLKEQLSAQPQAVQDLAFPIIDSLRQGKAVADVNPMLSALFRPSVQPYIISWFKYDPQREIRMLPIPCLIIQGARDIQVTTQDAEKLANANPKAQLVIVPKMNHILKEVNSEERAENIATYSRPELPLAAQLVEKIVAFIKAN